MSCEVHIEVKREFRFTKLHTRFYATCVEWAEKLNAISSGGVSVWFYLQTQPHPAWPRHSATICWKGMEVIRFFCTHEEGLSIYRTTYATDPGEIVNKRTVWERFLKPSWKSLLNKKLEAIDSQLQKIDSIVWEKIKAN